VSLPIPSPEYSEFGCIAYEGVSVGSGLPDSIDMGDNQRIVFAPPVQLDEFWKRELGDYQFQHLAKSNFAIELLQPEGATSWDKIASRLWGTMYSVLLFGIPRLIGGLEILGKRYENGTTVHRAITPYRISSCPHARAALLSGNAFMKARGVASGLREIHRTGAEFFRLRRGFLSWLSATRTELGDGRLHQFIRAVEAVVKPAQGKTKDQFVNRSALFTVNGDILSELFNLRSATEHMNDYSPIVTGNWSWDPERRGWYRSFQAELLAQVVYTRILSDPGLLEQFRTEGAIDAFWGMDDSSRRKIWGKAVNLNQLAQTRFIM